MNTDEISILLKEGSENKHQEVVERYLMLDEEDKLNEMAMMAYADSLYELGNDLASLEAYLNVVSLHVGGKVVDVALFGAAMTLKNLDLQEEAFHVLKLISPNYDGLDKELEHSFKLLSEQAKARIILEKLQIKSGH